MLELALYKVRTLPQIFLNKRTSFLEKFVLCNLHFVSKMHFRAVPKTNQKFIIILRGNC